MEYRYLGRTGLKVSAICLGSMQFGWTADEATSLHILDIAWQNGVNFIDTADIYSRWAEGNPGGISEEIIGKWIKRSAIPRHQLILATKVRGRMGEAPNDEGLSRLHIMHSVEASLKRLQTDVIDLYQVHWFDAQTPIEETLRALDDLIHQGKIRYIGCSNYPAWRLMQALWISDRLNLHTFVSVQPHYNLVHRAEFESELSEVCAWYGLGVIPYSPLAGGFLIGNTSLARWTSIAHAPAASAKSTTTQKAGQFSTHSKKWQTKNGVRFRSLPWHGCCTPPLSPAPSLDRVPLSS